MQLEVLLLNTLKGCIPIAPVHMTSLGNASFMQMNFTLATNWPAMQGRHGQFISHLLNLEKICQNLTFGSLCLSIGLSKLANCRQTLGSALG